jgi:hypothetical protein
MKKPVSITLKKLVLTKGICKLRVATNTLISHGYSSNQFCYYISAAEGLLIHGMQYSLLSTESLSAFLFPSLSKDSNT